MCEPRPECAGLLGYLLGHFYIPGWYFCLRCGLEVSDEEDMELDSE